MIPMWLYQTAFVLQLLSLALFLAYAARPGRGLAVAATWMLAFAAFLQLAFTGLLALQHLALPLGTPFESLNFWALCFTLVTLLLELRYQVGLLGVFLVPFSALLLLMGFRFEQALPQEPAALGGFFLLLHVGFPMAGYSFFTAAAGLGIAWMVAERQLKRGRIGVSSYQLPALETLERAAWRSTSTGVVFLALGLAWGMVTHWSSFLDHMLSDAKAAISLVTVLFYAVLLAFRSRGLRGRRFALLLLLGYTVLFFSYYLVNLYWGGHPLASTGVR